MISSEEEARAFIEAGWGGAAMQRCQILVEALCEENERQNLVSRTSLAHVWVRHVADSAQLLEHVGGRLAHWVDIGTGAGFPGLVIALLRPEITVTLLEPRRRRVAWLDSMIETCGLQRCRVVACNVEAFEPDSCADVVSARAVASLEELLVMTRHLQGSDTVSLFPKGANVDAELVALTPPMHAAYVFHVKHSLTSPEGRIIVVRNR